MSFTYVIESIDSKLISLECTKIKILILNNFGLTADMNLIKYNTSGSELRLADFVLDKKSKDLPVSWLNIKNSTHCCSKKCDKLSRKRKLNENSS